MLPSPSLPLPRRSSPVALDFQATTPCAPEVLEAMEPWWQQQWGNPSSRQHRLGLTAAAAVSDSRERLAACLKVDPTQRSSPAAPRKPTTSPCWAMPERWRSKPAIADT